MSGGRIKKHHFVPKVLQKPFRSEGDHIWYACRGENGRFGDVEDRNIESTFRLRDLYTVLDNDDTLSDEVERSFYGHIDNYLGKIIPDLLAAFERNEVPTFSDKALESLQRVTYEMIKRTPDFTRSYDDLEIGREFIEDVLKALEAQPDAELQRKFTQVLSDEASLRKQGRSIRVKGMIRKSEKVSEAMKDLVVRWAVIEGKQSFVLSSLVAYRIGNGGPNGLSNPSVEIWMPIAPKYAVVLVRDPNNKIPLRVTEDRDHVRRVNEYAIRNSAFVASHSDRLLKSLVKHGGMLS